MSITVKLCIAEINCEQHTQEVLISRHNNPYKQNSAEIKIMGLEENDNEENSDCSRHAE